MNKQYFITIESTSRNIRPAVQLTNITHNSSVAPNLLEIEILESATMTRMAHEKIGPEDLKQMIERDVRKSKSIYAPSGPPDTRLFGLFKEVSSQERIVKLASSEQTKIDVTFTLDLEPLSGVNPETLGSMIKMLLHDGHRRLVSGKIGVEESSYHDNPDRLVYTCARSHRSRIRKFIDTWKRAQLLDS